MQKLSLAFLFVIATAATACNATDKSGKFEISGKVTDSKAKNVAAQKIYLKEIDFAKNEPVVIDSQSIAKDGTFKLHSAIAGQHLFLINAGDGFPFLLINDNDKITYNFDASDPLHPSVSGSDATVKLYDFMNAYRLKDSSLNNTLVALDSLNKLPSTTHAQDSVMEVLDKQKTTRIDNINTSLKEFINSSDNAVAILYVMNFMSLRTMEPKDLLPLAESAGNRFKNDGSLAAFASRVKEAASGAGQQDDYNKDFNLLNRQAPDLAMQSPDGKPVKISDFKGKYLLVDFWASWCGPCRGENPNVVKVYNKYKDKNFTILGVSLDQDKAAWIKAIHDDKLTWNHMSDLKQWESAAVQTYHFNGIPFNVLIDPSGKIIAANLRGEDLDNKLGQIFDTGVANAADTSKNVKG